jgi:hypothetical protein
VCVCEYVRAPRPGVLHVVPCFPVCARKEKQHECLFVCVEKVRLRDKLLPEAAALLDPEHGGGKRARESTAGAAGRLG